MQRASSVQHRAVSDVVVRPFEERDYPGAVAVSNAVFPDFRFTEADWRHHDSRFDGKRLKLGRLVAESHEGVVGVADYRHNPTTYHPQKLQMELVVHPQAQGRGIGSELYDAAIEAAAPLEPIVWWANVRETMERGVSFAQHRGFREVRRAWELRLDVSPFDPTPFLERARQAVEGAEVVTLAEERERTPDWLMKIYELYVEVSKDVPRVDAYTPPTVEEYAKEFCTENPNWLPDGHFAVKIDGRYVAQSQLLRSRELEGVLYQRMTLTRREYRRRGLALALKLRTLEYARVRGFREIRTWVDSLNAPMLQINMQLGFARQPAWIFFEKRL